MNKPSNSPIALEQLVSLFGQTQSAMQAQAARSVDIALVVRNWLFGWYIVEFENGGAKRAELYGKALMQQLSQQLTQRLGKGFSQRSLEQCRKFYMDYKEIAQIASAQSSALSMKTPVVLMPSTIDKHWHLLSSKIHLPK